MRIRSTGEAARQVAIALQEGDARREAIAREVLRSIHSPAWRDAEKRYMASAGGES